MTMPLQPLPTTKALVGDTAAAAAALRPTVGLSPRRASGFLAGARRAAPAAAPEAAWPGPLAKLLTARQLAWMVGILGFVCFIPYPAFSAGNRSAVQLGNVLSALMALPVL